MNAEFLNNGVRLRWLNTAGFEIETSSGTHILLDPFLDGVYKGITCYPFSIDKIEKCDYLLLSHIHFDHAQNVGDLQHRFPALNLFVPDLSADPLCQVQDLDCARLHISPKQDFDEFAALTEAIGPKVVIPHHYDFTECFFKIVPAAMNDMSEENRRQFVHNGEFDFPAYMQALENACRRRAPGMALLMPEHHKWYRFGFCAAGPLE